MEACVPEMRNTRPVDDCARQTALVRWEDRPQFCGLWILPHRNGGGRVFSPRLAYEWSRDRGTPRHTALLPWRPW